MRGERSGRGGRSCARAVRRLVVGAALAVSGLAVCAGESAAQTALDEAVALQKRPEFDPIGVQPDFLGSFILFPKFVSTLNFDNNVFRADTDERSDLFYTLTPSLALRSDWDNHSFVLSGSGTAGRYFDNTSEEFNDMTLTAAGRTDILETSNLHGSLSHSRSHESRGAPDDVGGAEPSIFFQSTGKAGILYGEGEVGLGLDFSADKFNFRDNNGVNNDDRDRWEYRVVGRVSYEAVEGTKLFVEPSYNWIEYEDRFDDTGFERGSEGYKIEVGLTLDYSAVSFLEFAVGILQQTFDDARLADADGLFGRGKLTWNVTDISTVTAELEHRVNQTTANDASSTINDEFDIRYDHELLESLLFGLKGGYEVIEFVGIAREDEVLNGGLSVKYLMNEYMIWEFGADHLRKTSNEVGEEFAATTGFIKLTLQR